MIQDARDQTTYVMTQTTSQIKIMDTVGGIVVKLYMAKKIALSSNPITSRYLRESMMKKYMTQWVIFNAANDYYDTMVGECRLTIMVILKMNTLVEKN